MNRYLGRIFICLLGAMFTYSGGLKLWDPSAFSNQIAGYQIFPAAWIPPIALGLPVFELLTGIWLVTGWRTRPPLFAANLMLVVFSVALVSVVVRGLEIECGCFGSGDFDQPWIALARDLLLLAGTIPLYSSSLVNREKAKEDHFPCRMKNSGHSNRRSSAGAHPR